MYHFIIIIFTIFVINCKVIANNFKIHLCYDLIPIFYSNMYFKTWWLVLILKDQPSKYGFHLATVETRANNSFQYVDNNKVLCFNALP